MTAYETERQFIDISDVHFNGRVLDIGGGGEGIISRHSGNSVVAVDLRKEELEEAPDIGLKIIMDACDLKFLDKSFENVTCFFSLMYMDEDETRKFLREARRVLKHGGELWIWDIAIPPKGGYDVFVAQLEVQISNDLTVTTGYGVRWSRSRSLNSVREMCEDEGFILKNEGHAGQCFLLNMRTPD